MTPESIELPADLIKNRRDSTPAWLDILPETIHNCVQRWALELEPAFPRLSFNFAAPASRTDGERVVLKICPPDEEFLAETDMLALCDGVGMVRLLDADESSGALLLERLEPGKPIIELIDDVEATGAALEVMRQFWRPPPPQHRFRHVSGWFDRAFGLYRRQYGVDGPFDLDLLRDTEQLTRDLIDSSAEAVVLHGDLNYGNVLSAARQPWIAIDPKGIIGDPVFDTAILLHDSEPLILSRPDPRAFLARRVTQIVEHTGFSRERVLGWGLAYAVLSALWSSEYGASGWEGAITCAGLLRSLRES